MHRGYFVTFEGGEGSGKSTQIRRFERRLEDSGIPHLFLREPGGTNIGEQVRAILLDKENSEMAMRAELLLYEAARAQLVNERILPALEEGKLVCCDRFYDSSTAYQGYARRLSLEDIIHLNRFATMGLHPDLTFLCDIQPALGLKRATREGADRLEGEDLSFHNRVREGFLAIAREEPERFEIIDATKEIDVIGMEIWESFLSRTKGVF